MKPLLDHQQAITAAARVIYPDSDGKPIGETGIHVRASFHLYSALRWLFRRRLHTDVYVAASMFLYYQEGKPRANAAEAEIARLRAQLAAIQKNAQT